MAVEEYFFFRKGAGRKRLLESRSEERLPPLPLAQRRAKAFFMKERLVKRMAEGPNEKMNPDDEKRRSGAPQQASLLLRDLFC